EGDPHALVGGASGQFAPDLPVAREALGKRLAAQAPSEAGDAGRAEMVRIIDAVLPALKRLEVDLGFLERIAEHADRRDRDVAVADRIDAALAEFGKILAVRRLPEERFEAFEAHVGDL